MDPAQPTSLEQKITDSKKLVSQAIYDLRNLSMASAPTMSPTWDWPGPLSTSWR